MALKYSAVTAVERSRDPEFAFVNRKGSDPHYRHKQMVAHTVDTLHGKVDVIVDIDAIILDAARAALRSKSGRSKKQGGWVKAKVTKREVTKSVRKEFPIGENYEIVGEVKP